MSAAGKGLTADTIVSADDVGKRYGEGDTAVDALQGITTAVDAGSLVAVMGPSGSGKSTLLNVLAGLDRPTSGSVTLGGRDITKMDDRELTLWRRAKVGFVFQFFNLLPVLTAKENITLPLQIAGERPDEGWLEKLIDTVGIGDRRAHRPAELSGGQQQRVAIARALIARPAVVFADEPTGNLDSRASDEVLRLLRRSVDELGQTTVMVTHNPSAAAIADRVLMLSDGHLVRDLGRQTTEQILDQMKDL